MQGSLFLEYSRAFGNGNVLWIHKGIHAEIEQTMSDFLHVSGCWCEVSFCISEELLLHHCIIQTGIGIRKQNLHNLNDCFIYLIFIELLRKWQQSATIHLRSAKCNRIRTSPLIHPINYQSHFIHTQTLSLAQLRRLKKDNDTWSIQVQGQRSVNTDALFVIGCL